jgi:hypothetical protein
MSDAQNRPVPDVKEIDDRVLRDLESKYASTRCPVHDTPPKFEVDAKGGVVETFCCDALLQIVRELQAGERGE